MKDRVILHSDLNAFYASVEVLHQPQLRGLPVAVGGDPEQRHGIILAKTDPAKKAGVATGMALWQAREKCPGLIIVPPNFRLYLRFARMVRSIYMDYTDQVEPFGLDEAWCDVTGNCRNGIDGEKLADEIRARIERECGITASVGVSWNKIFAKLGSDMKKPNATTTILRDTYKDKVWPLPAEDLLYVGRATKRKLTNIGINTIGQLAAVDLLTLRSLFGKWGDVLYHFANGSDLSPVTRMGEESIIKSVGNSTTTPRDLENNEDVKLILYVLCESVAMRLREHGFKASVIEVHVRDNTLLSFTRQVKMARPTNTSGDLARAALELFVRSYDWLKPLRSIGVSGSGLVDADTHIQLSLLDNEMQRVKAEHLERAIDHIRQRFGNWSIRRAVLLSDRNLGSINPKDDHTIHPVGYFKDGRLQV